MSNRPWAPASERNRAPILGVLQHEFASMATVLEIGSGTGQHAVAFGAALRHLVWQTSDLPANLDAIRARVSDCSLENVLAPLQLDVLCDDLPAARYDAVFSANTAHIMNIFAVRRMFELTGQALVPDGVFCLYGPFREAGEFSADSNARFDAMLKSEDPSMGIRDLEQLDGFADASGMRRLRRYGMPANNLLVVWASADNGEVG